MLQNIPMDVKNLETTLKQLKEEATAFVLKEQEECNKLQAALQNKVREAQRKADQYEGRIFAIQELIAANTEGKAKKKTKQVTEPTPEG